MKFASICEGCDKRKLIIKKRQYTHSIAGHITSQSLLCRKCYKNINRMINPRNGSGSQP